MRAQFHWEKFPNDAEVKLSLFKKSSKNVSASTPSSVCEKSGWKIWVKKPCPVSFVSLSTSSRNRPVPLVDAQGAWQPFVTTECSTNRSVLLYDCSLLMLPWSELWEQRQTCEKKRKMVKTDRQEKKVLKSQDESKANWENKRKLFTDVLAGFTFNNKVLRKTWRKKKQKEWESKMRPRIKVRLCSLSLQWLPRYDDIDMVIVVPSTCTRRMYAQCPGLI